MILFSVSNRQRTEKSDSQSKLQDALKKGEFWLVLSKRKTDGNLSLKSPQFRCAPVMGGHFFKLIVKGLEFK